MRIIKCPLRYFAAKVGQRFDLSKKSCIFVHCYLILIYDKSRIVSRIAQQTGIEKEVVMTVVEAFMENVKDAMIAGNEVFLRGFGSFIIKQRAEKVARNISKNTTIVIPAHSIPAFKPAKVFLSAVKEGK